MKHYNKNNIIKAYSGTKFWNQLKNVTLAASVAENPAVMTASGWTIYPNGEVKLDAFNTPERNKLAESLSTIGEAGITAPTFGEDLLGVASAIRHPIRTGKAFTKAIKDAKYFITHPKSVKVYHGTGNPEFVSLKDAKTASENNIGVHVALNRQISESFTKGKENGHILEAWIPEHNMETIDIGSNDYRLLSNNFSRETRLKPYYYNAGGDDSFQFNLLKKYGAEPEIQKLDYLPGNQKVMYTNKDVVIPLRKETWPDISRETEIEVEKFLLDVSFKNLKSVSEFRTKTKSLNQTANNILSKNGKKVIKYNNTNHFEGGGGTSYIVTDPQVFYIPGKHSLDLARITSKLPVYGHLVGNKKNTK